jgi:ribosomal protein S20
MSKKRGITKEMYDEIKEEMATVREEMYQGWEIQIDSRVRRKIITHKDAQLEKAKYRKEVESGINVDSFLFIRDLRH